MCRHINLSRLRASARAAEPAPAPEAARRNVTVLFADLSGFTAMTEEAGSEKVHAILNDLFERLVPELTRHGGQVDKYMGDRVMALFGEEISIQAFDFSAAV